jgi:hypothetical protein
MFITNTRSTKMRLPFATFCCAIAASLIGSDLGIAQAQETARPNLLIFTPMIKAGGRQVAMATNRSQRPTSTHWLQTV